jgi:hypothetical protein
VETSIKWYHLLRRASQNDVRFDLRINISNGYIARFRAMTRVYWQVTHWEISSPIGSGISEVRRGEGEGGEGRRQRAGEFLITRSERAILSGLRNITTVGMTALIS